MNTPSNSPTDNNNSSTNNPEMVKLSDYMENNKSEQNFNTAFGGSHGEDTVKPKKRGFNLKMMLGVVVLFLVVLGSGAGFYLSQQTQDLRQQAQDYLPGEPAGCCEGDSDCPGPETCTVKGNGACSTGKSCQAPNTTLRNVCRNSQCAQVVCNPTENDADCTDPICGRAEDCTDTAGVCPNDPSISAKKYIKFTCPNGCTKSTESDGVTAWRCYGENGGDRNVSDSPLSLNGECGQVDVLSGSSDNSYCGYIASEYTCGEARCQTGGTPPSSNPPAVISCNSTCTSTSQCPSGNSCLKYYDFGDGWDDVSGNIKDIGSGLITSWDAFAYNGDITQILVRNGRIHHSAKLTDSFTNVTGGDLEKGIPKYDSNGSGTITSVNGYVNKSGAVEQWMVRGGEIYHSPSSGAPFTNITSHVTGVGSGTITAYTIEKYSTAHAGIVSAYLVRGGEIWHHTSSDWHEWKNVTDNVGDNSGTGSGSPTSFGFLVSSDGSITQHLVKDGILWEHNATISSNKKCRLPSHPNSTSCEPPKTVTIIPPTTTPTYEYICNSTSSIGGCVQISSDNTLTFKEGVGPYSTQTQCTDACKPKTQPKQVDCGEGCGPDNNNDTCDTSAGLICRVGACVLRKNPNSALCTPSAVASCGEGCGANFNNNTCTSGLTCTAGSCVLTSNPNSALCTPSEVASCGEGCGATNNNNTCIPRLTCQDGSCVLASNPTNLTCREIIAPMCKDVAILDVKTGEEIDPQIAVPPFYKGQEVQFICASEDVDSQVDHYEFKITEPGSGEPITGAEINPASNSSTSLSYTIPQNGSFGVQCKVCTSATECQDYISIGTN